MAQAARRKNVGRIANTARTSRAAEEATRVPRARTDKLSVSLRSEDVVWVTRRAKRLGTSVSAVIAAALADQRRAEAQGTLLSLLGDTDISETAVEAARREAFGE